MGGESFVLYYGVRYEIEDESEIHSLEHSTSALTRNPGEAVQTFPEGIDINRLHSKVNAAVGAGLEWTWGVTQEETYYLLIGKELGVLGWEHAGDVAIPTQDLEAAIAETRQRLAVAGLNAPVALHAHHEPDF